MLLHKDKELFHEVIISAAEELGISVPMVEKDYYITLILEKITKKYSESVLKGEIALSKCNHLTDRFSENIEIAFSSKAFDVIKVFENDDDFDMIHNNICNRGVMGIGNVNTRKSPPIHVIRADNAEEGLKHQNYKLKYEPENGFVFQGKLIQELKLDILFEEDCSSIIKLPVESYVYDFLKKQNIDIIEEYALWPFMVNVQSIEKLLLDNILKICDNYKMGNIKECSINVYDIHMLLNKIKAQENSSEFECKIKENHIINGNILEKNIKGLLNEIIENDMVKSEYFKLKTYFQSNSVDYECVKQSIKSIINANTLKTNNINSNIINALKTNNINSNALKTNNINSNTLKANNINSNTLSTNITITNITSTNITDTNIETKKG